MSNVLIFPKEKPLCKLSPEELHKEIRDLMAEIQTRPATFEDLYRSEKLLAEAKRRVLKQA